MNGLSFSLSLAIEAQIESDNSNEDESIWNRNIKIAEFFTKLINPLMRARVISDNNIVVSI